MIHAAAALPPNHWKTIHPASINHHQDNTLQAEPCPSTSYPPQQKDERDCCSDEAVGIISSKEEVVPIQPRHGENSPWWKQKDNLSNESADHSDPPPMEIVQAQHLTPYKPENPHQDPGAVTATGDPQRDSQQLLTVQDNTGHSRTVKRKRKKQSTKPLEEIYEPNKRTQAVNITKADYERLLPHQYLNNTVIEFGLQLWHHELAMENPELAQQIHIFNSFFYSKLNKDSIQAGYENVRRWTSKFDIFEKKFVIVPINENQHWCLAIVYQPGLVLLPSSEPRLPNTSLPSDVPQDTIYYESDAEETVCIQLLTVNNPPSPNANEPAVVHPIVPHSSQDESDDPQFMNLAEEHNAASLPPYTPAAPPKAVAPSDDYIHAIAPTTISRPMIFTFDSLGE
ncbi:hypothetical protein HHX47_DHR5000213 [Lentinula edodes]|nr:hypothetical protein HHX47_DHR5000213 [Lentinula edodes]